MSRCFPFTRPNYKRDDVSLVGSIKNQWGNTKQRKEKQNKKRPREEYDKLDSLEQKNKKRKDDKKNKFNESCHYDTRSDLSEEHYPPAFVLSRCNSSRSIQNGCNKNGVEDAGLNRKISGMVLRIKLPLRELKDLKPVSAVQAGLTESHLHRSSKATELSKEQAVLTEYPLRTKKTFSASDQEPCFSGRVSAEAGILHKGGVVEAITGDSKHKRRCGGSSIRRCERRQFRDLIINWKPQPPPTPPELNEAEEGELDWLFAPRKSQQPEKANAQICKASGISDPTTCTSTISASCLQPRALYLPEFHTYQMPYAIPF